jgi:hypothetical protein
MDILVENEGKLYGAITIKRFDGFVSPFAGFEFLCLIWDHDGRFADAERSAVARATARSWVSLGGMRW